MRLRLSELREAAKEAMDDQRAAKQFVAEIKGAFGRVVDIDADVVTLAELANYSLDVMDAKMSSGRVRPLTEAALRFAATHRDPELRKLAARLVPSRDAKRFVFDEDPEVRHAAARRMPASVVLEALKSHGDDDELHLIYRRLRLAEAKATEQHRKLSGDVIKQQDFPELSDGFYVNLAEKFLNDYGMSWQQNWPLMVQRYVSSVRATSGVDIDGKKLLDKIREIIDEREEEVLDDPSRASLRETIEALERQMDPIDESDDPVNELLVSRAGAVDFIDRVCELYAVKESYIPNAIKKHRLGEAERQSQTVPQRASTPHGKAVNERDEIVLDRFCEAWNNRQALTGEPLRLEWYVNPIDASLVGFSVSLL